MHRSRRPAAEILNFLDQCIPEGTMRNQDRHRARKKQQQNSAVRRSHATSTVSRRLHIRQHAARLVRLGQSFQLGFVQLDRQRSHGVIQVVQFGRADNRRGNARLL